MNLPSRFKLLKYAVLFLLLLSMTVAFSTSTINTQAKTLSQTVNALPIPLQPAPVRFWVQTLDSCQIALPGAYFTLTGPGLTVPEGPTPGTHPVTIAQAHGKCPVQRGNCSAYPTGCLSWMLPVPIIGTVHYQIKETQSPANYAICTGGSVCPGGPVVVNITMPASGQPSATVYNVYPDGTSVTWPSTGAAYTGTQTDPAVVHNFGLGNGSCDGDNDADDHLTGSPSSHCDNDHDRPTTH